MKPSVGALIRRQSRVSQLHRRINWISLSVIEPEMKSLGWKRIKFLVEAVLRSIAINGSTSAFVVINRVNSSERMYLLQELVV